MEEKGCRNDPAMEGQIQEVNVVSIIDRGNKILYTDFSLSLVRIQAVNFIWATAIGRLIINIE